MMAECDLCLRGCEQSLSPRTVVTHNSETPRRTRRLSRKAGTRPRMGARAMEGCHPGPSGRWLRSLVILIAVQCVAFAGAEGDEAHRQLSFPLIDLAGTIHQLGQNPQGQIRGFVFLSPECPISNSVLQSLNTVSEHQADKRVAIFGVVADPTISRDAAARHFREFGVTFPVLFDQAGLLADILEPQRVPEAFLLDADQRVIYRGAIDDTWTTVGRRKPTATRHYFAEAIAASRAGQPVELSRTKAVGCLFESFQTVQAAGDRTYCRDVAPIIFSRCLSCHRAGQVAPFALETYEQTAKRARWIATVAADEIMPPWPPHQTQRRLIGARGLTEKEKAVLADWAASGRRFGDRADLPPTPTFSSGWRLGQPDLVLKMPEPFAVPANGPDIFQHFVIPIDIPADRLVTAIELHPGNKRVVHHAVLFLDSTGTARKLDAVTPEAGYGRFGGPGFSPTGALGGWSVGNTPRHLPSGMGRYLAKGSDLVLQMHYHPSGKPETDQSEVGLFFAADPVSQTLAKPAKLVGSIWLANYQMDIPPGQSDYRRTTSYKLPRDVILVGVVPHMHLLGKSMRVTAELPTADDGSATEQLIEISDWNFNWQDEYYYEQPFRLPAGTRLCVEAVFDNSENNPANPSTPPRRVTWGDETDDEMLFCFFLISADSTRDLMHVIYDNLAHDARQPRAPIGRQGAK